MPKSLLTWMLASLLVVNLVAGCAAPVIRDTVKRSTVAPTAAPQMAETPLGAPAERRRPPAVDPAATPASEAPAVQPAATPAPKPPRGTWGLEVANRVQPEAVEAILAALNGAAMPSETVTGQGGS